MGLVQLITVLLGLFLNSDHLTNEATIRSVDKSEQFGEVKLGAALSAEFTELKDVRVMERRSHDNDGIKWYRFSRSPESMDGIELRYVFYGFKDQRLVEIAIAFKNQAEKAQNARAFAKLREFYNGGTRVTNETWLWSGERVGLDFSGYCELDTGSLMFLYIFPKSRVYNFAENATRKSSTDENSPLSISK